MNKFNVEKLANGNFYVTVSTNDKIVMERAYDDISGVVSLLVMTFEPK